MKGCTIASFPLLTHAFTAFPLTGAIVRTDHALNSTRFHRCCSGLEHLRLMSDLEQGVCERCTGFRCTRVASNELILCSLCRKLRGNRVWGGYLRCYLFHVWFFYLLLPLRPPRAAPYLEHSLTHVSISEAANILVLLDSVSALVTPPLFQTFISSISWSFGSVIVLFRSTFSADFI